jgi:LDH2 family malate/lactate/ureidoglycolate dehydrogenase
MLDKKVREIVADVESEVDVEKDASTIQVDVCVLAEQTKYKSHGRRWVEVSAV